MCTGAQGSLVIILFEKPPPCEHTHAQGEQLGGHVYHASSSSFKPRLFMSAPAPNHEESSSRSLLRCW